MRRSLLRGPRRWHALRAASRRIGERRRPLRDAPARRRRRGLSAARGTRPRAPPPPAAYDGDRARDVPSARRALVRGPVRRADRAAGARLAGDRRPPRRARLRADGLRQDARRLPLRHRRPVPRRARGPARRRDPGPLRLAAARARERRREEPARPARGARRARARGGAPAAGPARRGPLRRHARVAAGGDGARPAAHPRDDARVALPPPHRGARPGGARRRSRR